MSHDILGNKQWHYTYSQVCYDKKINNPEPIPELKHLLSIVLIKIDDKYFQDSLVVRIL